MADYTTNWTANRADDWLRLIGHLQGTPCRILEIGNWEGRSTNWFLSNCCQHPNSELRAVDPHPRPDRYSRFLSNVSANEHCSRLQIFRGRSSDICGTWPRNTFDAAYIDGSHEGLDVMTDAVLCWRLLRPGGIMIFDDYRWKGDGRRKVLPRHAIDAFVELTAPWATVVLHKYQVAVQKTQPRDAKTDG